MLGSFRGEEGDVGELLHLDLVLQVLNVVAFEYRNFNVPLVYVKCMFSVLSVYFVCKLYFHYIYRFRKLSSSRSVLKGCTPGW